MSALVVAAPIRPSSRSGNDVTATRWATHLRELGHDVSIVSFDEAPGRGSASVLASLDAADALIALHARRSSDLVRLWRERRGRRPVVVALTGTDLYGDLPDDPSTSATVDVADALIVLQRAAADRVARMHPDWGTKVAVVHQSLDPSERPERRPADDEFRVVVLAHLRDVKDPLLAARAARLVPESSRLVVHHAGSALDDEWRRRAEAEADANPRYRWHGDLDRPAALELLASAHVLACTSLAEGGANVVTEAIGLGVPVVGTHIDGNTGLLGTDHPGLVPVGDHESLAELLVRIEHEPGALAELQRRTDELASLADPITERRALAHMIATLTT